MSKWRSILRLGSSLVAVFTMMACLLPLPAQAADFNNRALQLVNDSPSTTTSYINSFTLSNSSTIGSLELLFCANTPIQTDSCSLPSGLDVSNAQLSAQSGLNDFTLFSAATNELVLSRPPSFVTAPLSVSLTLDNIINPSSPGPYYLRLSAYSSTNASGGSVDFGGLAFAIANNLQVSSVVTPYLIFCSALTISNFDCSTASGDYINFGDLKSTTTSLGNSQLVVATNAPNGYVIQVTGTTMTAGNHIIPAMTGGTSQAGTSQFGLNLRFNSDPATGADPTGPGGGQPAAAYNNPNHFQFADGDTIVNSQTSDNFRKYTASYIVNVAASQAPGIYASTLTYVCAGSF